MGTIQTAKYREQPAVVLENDILRVTVLPGRGGKTASIYHKALDFELLYQSPPERNYPPLIPGMPFAHGDASGFDDCFPNIVPELTTIDDQQIHYPDHGEVWTLPFSYDIQSDALILSTHSRLLSYQYQKTIHLFGSSVQYRYHIHNTGNQSIPCLWTCHCLVVQQPEMLFIYPMGSDEIENVLEGALGDRGLKLKMVSAPYDLAALPPEQEPGMTKFYFSKACSRGYCGYTYPKQNASVALRFDEKKLPYLGVWQTQGGYRGDYNCALEPSSGYYDSISMAEKHDTVKRINQGESWDFYIYLELSKIRE